jgi:hypothetical protein
MAMVEQLARDLAIDRIKVMVLKGPHVQRRLLGSPTAYASADADLLVPRRAGRRARQALAATGWHFADDNGRLWRLDGAAAYVRGGVVIDLHWGLHAGLLPASALRPIERAMWASADGIAPNLYEPGIDALAAYLAIHHHGAGHHHGKLRLLTAAIDGADGAAVLALAPPSPRERSGRASIAPGRGEETPPAHDTGYEP